MHLIAEAGTDGAIVALWDPEALPEGFDDRYRHESLELLELLQSEGKLFWTETGSDGAFLLHLFVDQAAPDHLAPYLQDPVEIPAFQVPGGTLWFAGAEYVYRVEGELLRAHPHMGTRMELPAGVYRACFRRCEYPDDFIEDQVRSRLGNDAYRFRDASGGLIAAATFVSLAGIIALIFSRFAPWSIGIIAVGALLWVAVAKLSRSDRYREVGRRSEEIEREFPSMIAELRSPERT